MESQETKKRKIKPENIVFWILFAGLFLYMIFRTEVNIPNYLCKECSVPEDCEKGCTTYCIRNGCDLITSLGFVDNDSIYCSCKCNTNLHVFLDRFL
jgi:hypothetical protein